LVKGIATAASHSWKWAMTARSCSLDTNYHNVSACLDDEGMTYFSQEPRYKIAKHNGLVGLVVTSRRRNTSLCPQITFPLVKPSVTGTGIDEQNPWCALDQPPSIHYLDTSLLHRSYCVAKVTLWRLNLFDFDRGLGLISVLAWHSFSALTEALLRGPMRT
jgi:hypothetical protein